MKKYELVPDLTTEFNGKTLYRIRALTSFSDVKTGDLGGWVEKEDCLSQFGDAWVYDDAEVGGDAVVSGDSRVSGNAKMFGDAWVYGNDWVCDNADLSGIVDPRDADLRGISDLIVDDLRASDPRRLAEMPVVKKLIGLLSGLFLKKI